MRIWIAGQEEYWRCLRTESGSYQKKWSVNYGLLCYLLINHYVHYYKEFSMRKVKLFLDSGAFSAWTKGVEIDIDEYIKFIKKYKKYLECYANLDVIGSAEETYKNQKYMESKGLKPLPVFHLQDKFSWLDRYLDEGYDYIGIGGIAGKSTVGARKHFLSRVWDRITDEKGYPLIKTHGFGMTAVNLIVQYPWWSVDSTSWLSASRLGDILVPRPVKGKPSFLVKPLSISVSEKSPNKKIHGKHFDSLTEKEKEYVLNYLTEMNITLKDVSEDYKARDKVCVLFYQRLQDSLPKYPWPMKKDVRKSFI